MAQKPVSLEDSQWVAELRAAIGDKLVDVRYVAEGDGYDFLIVYSPGSRRLAIDRFTEALRRAPDMPPFDLIGFEQGLVPEYYGEYQSVNGTLLHAEQR